MRKLLPFILFLFLSRITYSQIDSAVEARNTLWHKEHYAILLNNPSYDHADQFLSNLTAHTYNSTIPLKELKFYIEELEVFFRKHPELKKAKYQLQFVKAIMEMYTGHPERFQTIINETEEELKRDKLYRELFHLNLQVCHFLPSVNYTNEAKVHFYENEQLLSDLKASGVTDFSKFEIVQIANSFGFLFLNEDQLDSAEKYYRIGLERATANKDSTWIGIISGNLGSVLARKGNYKMAERLLELDKRESLRSKQTTSAINAILGLVDIKLSQNKIKEAEVYMYEADSLINGLNLSDDEMMNFYYVEQANRFGHLYLLKGDKEKAKQNFERAYVRLKSRYRKNLFLMSNLNNRRFAFEENVHKIAELEEKSQRRQNIIWFIGLLLVSLLIILFNQWRFNRKLRDKNKQIEEQALNLKDLNAQKVKLFSIVAHDMRSPFANLRNLIDLHSDKAISDEEFLAFCKDINTSIHGLSGTFDNIMSWAKVGMEQGIQVKTEAIDFPVLLNEVRNQLLPLLELKEISIKFVDSCSQPIQADKNLMIVVIRNLFHNAIKFSHKNSEILVELKLNPDHSGEACIVIKDNGIGMEEENIIALMNSGSKKSTMGTAGEKGSGLGLMICYEFILAMNGRLKIQSKIGEGSEFTICLPLASVEK